MTDIRMFRTVTGEDVIGEYVATSEFGDEYINVIQLVVVPSRENANQQNIGFAPFPAFVKPKTDVTITFPVDKIAFYISLDPEFEAQYKEIFGHIVTPTSTFLIGK